MEAADEDLSSEFEYQSGSDVKKRKKSTENSADLSLDDVSLSKKSRTIPTKDLFFEEQQKEESRKQKLLCLDAYSRHKQLINEYYLYYPGATKQLGRDTSKDKTDIDVIREHHKFLWDESEEPDSWEKKLAKRYHDKLFKEYCIVDLSRYKENKIAMRWRTEKEVIAGTGQFSCGCKKCIEKQGLSSWEVNFCYVENDQKKNALVKLRLCPDCSCKLNYRHKRKLVTKKPKLVHKEHTNLKLNSEKKETTSDAIENSQEIQQASQKMDPDVWKKPVEIEQEKPRDEEFEDFLDDLLL